jgi:hypothetical protein
VAQAPEDEKMYNSLLLQAKSRWPNHKNSGIAPAGLKWVSEQYVQRGGAWVGSKKDVPLNKRDEKTRQVKAKKAKEKRVKKEAEKKGFVA